TTLVVDPKPLVLHHLSGRRNPPYYRTSSKVTDLCAIPLMEHAHLRGILCADRTDGRAFASDEQAILQQAAGQILRIIAHERVFAAVERSKYEQEQFYRASELLNEALTVDEVY